MDLDKVFGWVIAHNTVLIETIFFVILVLTALYLFYSLMYGKSESASSTDLASLEKTLKKVLENQGPVAAAPARPTTGNPETDAEKLFEELQEKESEISKLKDELAASKKAAPAATTPAAPAVDTGQVTELNNKLKSLESRLAEYEIIEEDIANLSLYKDENSRLKNQLSELTKKLSEAPAAPAAAAPAEAAAPAPAEAAAPAPAEAATPAAEGDKRVEAIPLPNEVPAPAAQGFVPPAPATDSPAAPPPDEDSLVAAFARAMDSGEISTQKTDSPKPASPAVPAGKVGVAETPKPESAAVAAEAPEIPPAPPPQTAPSAGGTSPGVGVPEALTGPIDTSKLADEVAALAAAPPDSPEGEEGDPALKLISEFENFMKESKT